MIKVELCLMSRRRDTLKKTNRSVKIKIKLERKWGNSQWTLVVVWVDSADWLSVTYILLSFCTFYPQVGDRVIVTGYLGSICVAVVLAVAPASPLSCSWPWRRRFLIVVFCSGLPLSAFRSSGPLPSYGPFRHRRTGTQVWFSMIHWYNCINGYQYCM